MSYHKDKHIHAAIAYAIAHGWTFLKRNGRGHAVGILRCGTDNKCHQKSVWGTPVSPQNHAEEIKQLVDRCRNQK